MSSEFEPGRNLTDRVSKTSPELDDAAGAIVTMGVIAGGLVCAALFRMTDLPPEAITLISVGLGVATVAVGFKASN